MINLLALHKLLRMVLASLKHRIVIISVGLTGIGPEFPKRGFFKTIYKYKVIALYCFHCALYMTTKKWGGGGVTKKLFILGAPVSAHSETQILSN